MVGNANFELNLVKNTGNWVHIILTKKQQSQINPVEWHPELIWKQRGADRLKLPKICLPGGFKPVEVFGDLPLSWVFDSLPTCDDQPSCCCWQFRLPGQPEIPKSSIFFDCFPCAYKSLSLSLIFPIWLSPVLGAALVCLEPVFCRNISNLELPAR